ncbi:neurocalcin-like [Tropilaelaps mercedesae]|uniref:Neurocalcin-like n=1 Tax=Tropilaelaps mercedesae TaxID=418985 RepID=A0A1V9XFK5_9ACAR|nr:neurocalcin-like [Tropilaelaps mercedesae]
MGKAGSKLSPADLKDFKSCSHFTEKEISDFYSNFHKAYPKGRMSSDELQAMYAKLFPDGDANEFAENVFRVIDQDGDGTVDFREYLVSMSATLHGSPLEILRRAFVLYDVDGDGFITEDEMSSIFMSYHRLRGGSGSLDQSAKSIIRQFDTNHDQKLSFEEFVQCAQKMPKIVDQMMAQRRTSVASK